MPKYKNIRTKRGTRRVRILANGQYRFISNKRKSPKYHRPKKQRSRKPHRRQKRQSRKAKKKYNRGNSGLF